MQQVLIKKFTLLRNGVEYKAGTILELPEVEANALVAGAPKEFEKVSVESTEKAERTLKDFTNTELKALCEERGLEAGLSHQTYTTVYAPFTPSKSG